LCFIIIYYRNSAELQAPSSSLSQQSPLVNKGANKKEKATVKAIGKTTSKAANKAANKTPVKCKHDEVDKQDKVEETAAKNLHTWKT
jgi:hypothetical protein